MRTFPQDDLDQGRGIAPDRIGLPPQAPVARRHVLAHRMSLMVPSLFGNELDSRQLQHAKVTATPNYFAALYEALLALLVLSESGSLLGRSWRLY